MANNIQQAQHTCPCQACMWIAACMYNQAHITTNTRNTSPHTTSSYLKTHITRCTWNVHNQAHIATNTRNTSSCNTSFLKAHNMHTIHEEHKPCIPTWLQTSKHNVHTLLSSMHVHCCVHSYNQGHIATNTTNTSRLRNTSSLKPTIYTARGTYTSGLPSFPTCNTANNTQQA